MGRGRSKSGEAAVRSQYLTLLKQERSARAAVTRAQNKYTMADVAVRYFDGDKDSERFRKYLSERDRAEKALQKANEKYRKIDEKSKRTAQRLERFNRRASADDEIIPF